MLLRWIWFRFWRHIYIQVYIYIGICGFHFSWTENSGSYSELHGYKEELGAKLRLRTSHQGTHVFGGSFTYLHIFWNYEIHLTWVSPYLFLGILWMQVEPQQLNFDDDAATNDFAGQAPPNALKKIGITKSRFRVGMPPLWIYGVSVQSSWGRGVVWRVQFGGHRLEWQLLGSSIFQVKFKSKSIAKTQQVVSCEHVVFNWWLDNMSFERWGETKEAWDWACRAVAGDPCSAHGA